MVSLKVFVDFGKKCLIVLTLLGCQLVEPGIACGLQRGDLRIALCVLLQAHANGHHVGVKTRQSQAQNIGVPSQGAHEFLCLKGWGLLARKRSMKGSTL